MSLLTFSQCFFFLQSLPFKMRHDITSDKTESLPQCAQFYFQLCLFYITGVPLKVLKQVRLALDGKFQKMLKLTFDDQLVFFYHKVIC